MTQAALAAAILPQAPAPQPNPAQQITYASRGQNKNTDSNRTANVHNKQDDKQDFQAIYDREKSRNDQADSSVRNVSHETKQDIEQTEPKAEKTTDTQTPEPEKTTEKPQNKPENEDSGAENQDAQPQQSETLEVIAQIIPENTTPDQAQQVQDTQNTTQQVANPVSAENTAKSTQPAGSQDQVDMPVETQQKPVLNTENAEKTQVTDQTPQNNTRPAELVTKPDQPKNQTENIQNQPVKTDSPGRSQNENILQVTVKEEVTAKLAPAVQDAAVKEAAPDSGNPPQKTLADTDSQTVELTPGESKPKAENTQNSPKNTDIANQDIKQNGTETDTKSRSSRQVESFESQLNEKIETKSLHTVSENHTDKTTPIQSSQNAAQTQSQPAANTTVTTAATSVSATGSVNATAQSQAMTPTEQIVTAVNSMRNLTSGQISLQLNPSELGAIKIRFEQSDGQLTGIIEAQRPETQKELEKAVPELSASLQGQGIQVNKIQVQAPTPQQQPQNDKNQPETYDSQLHREFQNESGQGGSGNSSSDSNLRNGFSSNSYSANGKVAADTSTQYAFSGGANSGLNLYI